LGYDFEIQYCPGKSNTVADTLSRVEPLEESLLVLSILHLDFLDALKLSLSTNSEFQDLKTKINATFADFPGFAVHHEFITYKDKIRFPSSCPFIPLLLHEFHSTPLAVARTLSRLLASFYWNNIRKDVQDYVAACTICQQTKIPTQRHVVGRIFPWTSL